MTIFAFRSVFCTSVLCFDAQTTAAEESGAFLQEAQSLFFISELLAHIMKSVKLKGISKP